MTCPPLVHAVHDRHTRWTCAGCFASLRPARGAESDADPDGVGGVGCDDCDGHTRYCSSSCRSRDTSHVAECALCLRAGDDPRLRDATRGLRLFLRLLHLRAMDPDAFAPFGALRASFADAESADSNPWDASFRIPEKYLGMSRAVNGIASPPARVPERELATILAAAHANLHGVVDAEGRHLGSGVYVRASMFNHSCAPEAVVSFNPGGVLRVHAVEDISVDAPIRIAYSELYATRGSRRDALRAKKGFECACERCVDVDGKWTRRDAALDGWACADATCDGSVRPRDGSNPTDATCDACGTTLSNPPSPTRTREWADAANAACVTLARGDARAAATIAHGTLRDSTGRLHERHVIRHELRLVAADAAYAAGEWAAAADARERRARRDARDALGISPGVRARRDAVGERADSSGGGGGGARGRAWWVRARSGGGVVARRYTVERDENETSERRVRRVRVRGGGAGNLVRRRPRGDDRRAREGNDGAPIPRPRD